MTAGCVFFFLVAYVGYMMYDWILGSFGKRIQRSSYDHPWKLGKQRPWRCISFLRNGDFQKQRRWPVFPWVCWINDHPGILTKRHPFWQNRFLKILMFGDGFIGWGDPKIQLNLRRWVERISDRTCLANWGSNPPMKSQRMEETYARLCPPERNWSVFSYIPWRIYNGTGTYIYLLKNPWKINYTSM